METSDAVALAKIKELVLEEIAQAVAEGDYTGPEGSRLRAVANKHAMERSRLYEMASNAYEEGDGERAKALSDEAAMEGSKMREANKKAAEAIFNHRNDENETSIDLHGLTVAEALGFLKIRLQKLLSNEAQDELTCITGAGNHSPGQLARIRPAVRKMCQQNKLKCTDDDNPGTFVIHC